MVSTKTPTVESGACRTRSIINRRSLSIFSRRGTETPVQLVGPFSMRTAHSRSSHSIRNAPKNSLNTMHNAPASTANRRMKARRGTVLRAVPMAEKTTPAPLSSLEQEMATSPNEEILNAIGRSPSKADASAFHSLPQNYPHPSRTFSVKTSKLSPTLSRREKCSSKDSPSPDDTIGFWKNGRVQWERGPSIPLVSQLSDAFLQADATQRSIVPPSTKKVRRPKIQVIIPGDHRIRPFPSLPFFNSSSIKSATAEIGYGPDVSPPSGSAPSPPKNKGRSGVSPLSSQTPLPVQQFKFSSKPLGLAELDLHRPVSDHEPKQSLSNSSEGSEIEDDASRNSKRSSMTSLEESSPVEVKPISLHVRSASGLSASSPIAAGSAPLETPCSPAPSDPNAQDVQICLQVPAAQCSTKQCPSHDPHPALEHDKAFEPTCSLRQPRSVSYVLPRRRVPSPTRRASVRSAHTMSSATIAQFDIFDHDIAKKDIAVQPLPSPTLSEAEHDLAKHLTTMTDDNPFKWDDVVAKAQEQVDDIDEIYGPAPAVPRKSSKRASHLNPKFRLSRVPTNHIASQIKRKQSNGKNLTLKVPSSKRMTDDFMLSPIPIAPTPVERRNITPESAENVILTILYSLHSLEDLFSTAIIDRGFYRVFKRHELDLMKSALLKMSPPAWEHREMCPPESDDEDDLEKPRPEYTPTTYLQYYSRDLYTIAALKALIANQCQSILRQDMIVSITSDDRAESSRAEDALWRIWTFCKLFGSGKGREEDIIGQMDWLKGGELVNQKGCRSTILTTESLDMNGALANAPECFALGNNGGLTLDQLYDMTEIWNCLGVLLQGLHNNEGRTIQAREYGVYENTEIRGGDIDGEEVMLDEWCCYLLTLGLSAILDLATRGQRKGPSVFIMAAENGWMDWNPPAYGGSRCNFLKEAVSRVYEEKVAASFSSSSQKDMLRQLSKQRVQRHITEIRRRKTSGEELQEIRMSQERPISEWEDVFDKLTRTHPSEAIPQLTHPSEAIPQPPTRPHSTRPHSILPPSRLQSSLPPMRSPPPTSPLPPVPTTTRSSLPPRFSPPPRTIAMPLLPTPPSTIHPSPAATAVEPVFIQHPLQRQIFSSNNAENTAEKAIYRIVEMGFTADQARHALRVTDLGDGLRIDRAVELLLRGDL